MQRLLSALPFFQEPRLSSLELVVIEAAQYIDPLGRAESAIFAPDVMRIKKGKYQDFIPGIWLWGMTEFSLFINQTDEYMESVIVHIGEAKLSLLVSQVAYGWGLQDLPTSGGEPRKERLNGQQISNSGSDVHVTREVGRMQLRIMSCSIDLQSCPTSSNTFSTIRLFFERYRLVRET
ncbi:MAG: hypothetical protein Q9180_008572 [Flavoplaca navasiana]